MMQDLSFPKRKLIGLERYYLLRPAINTLLAARIKGSFSSDQIRLALSKVVRKHPLLTSIVSFDEDKSVSLLSNDTASLSLRVIPKESADDWINIILEESKFPFAFTVEPMVRVVLLQARESSDIVINSHHMICDGMALTYLFKDILFYLNNPEHEAKPVLYPFPLSKADFPTSVSLDITNKAMIGIFNGLWGKKDIGFNEDDYKKLHHTFYSIDRKRRLLTWELSELQTNALINRCKKENVTINSAIVTAFSLAQINIQGKLPYYLRNITIPVNIRNRLESPLGDVVGTFISAFMLKPKINKEKSFWDQVRLLQTKIKKYLI